MLRTLERGRLQSVSSPCNTLNRSNKAGPQAAELSEISQQRHQIDLANECDKGKWKHYTPEGALGAAGFALDMFILPHRTLRPLEGPTT